LKLSNLWYFWDLRQEENDFGHLSALKKIRLERECYIPDCLLSGYLDFVTRYEAITDEEATANGLLAAVRLSRFREELIDIRKRAEGHLPSGGPARSSSLG
jgi:hypothetical protein